MAKWSHPKARNRQENPSIAFLAWRSHATTKATFFVCKERSLKNLSLNNMYVERLKTHFVELKVTVFLFFQLFPAEVIDEQF